MIEGGRARTSFPIMPVPTCSIAWLVLPPNCAGNYAAVDGIAEADFVLDIPSWNWETLDGLPTMVRHYH